MNPQAQTTQPAAPKTQPPSPQGPSAAPATGPELARETRPDQNRRAGPELGRGAITIRPLASFDEYTACENLQKTIWAFSEREIIPTNELVTLPRIGGCVLGAFDGRGRMVGFTFGMPGLDDRKVVFCSRMTGILPEQQGRGLGLQLKLEQRRHIQTLKIKRALWTFDPLQSANAHFNIEKLGCFCREYLQNAYGQSVGPSNRGWDTDRLVPEWWVESNRVKNFLAGKKTAISVPKALESKSYTLVLEEAPKTREITVPANPRLDATTQYLLLQVPYNILHLKNLNPEIARTWRQQSQAVLTHYLAKKYTASRFLVHRVDKTAKCYYVLERGFKIE